MVSGVVSGLVHVVGGICIRRSIGVIFVDGLLSQVRIAVLKLMGVDVTLDGGFGGVGPEGLSTHGTPASTLFAFPRL